MVTGSAWLLNDAGEEDMIEELIRVRFIVVL
jgi:hypothetical protein